MRLGARGRDAEGVTLSALSVVPNEPSLSEVPTATRGPVRWLPEEGQDRTTMKQRQENTVLFLCTGNYYRSRFAEVLFNSVAGKMGLPWRASSRGFALERGVNNVGPRSEEHTSELQSRGLRAGEAISRMPAQVT